MTHRDLRGRDPSARVVLEALDELFLIMDANGCLLRWNRRLGELTGLSDEKLGSMRFADLTSADDRERVTEMVRRVLGGRSTWIDLNLAGADDCNPAVTIKAGLYRGDGGPLIYARGVPSDEYAEYVPDARSPAEPFQDVLSNLPVYLFTQDDDLRYTWLSHTSLVDDPRELEGMTDYDLLPAEEARHVEAIKRRVLRTGNAARLEFCVTLSGRKRWYDAHLAALRSDDARITGIAGAAVDISSRKEAEGEHLTSEKRYRELFETARDGIAIHTPDGTILDINRSGLEMLGYSRTELEELDTADIYPYPEQAERGAEIMQQHGEVRNLEVTLRCKDDREIVCLLSSIAQKNEAGETVQYFTLFRDITQRKKYQDQFRMLVEEVEDYAIFMMDPEGHITTWNEGAEKIKGYSREEILGQHLSIFYPEEDRTAGKTARLLETAAREGCVEDENWRVRRDGSRFWARATLTAVRDEQGRLRGFAKVTRDLSDRRAREEKIRQSEERYRRLFEESQEGIGISTPDGRGIDANPAAQEILGYRKEELLRINLEELYVDPEQRRKVRDILIRRGAIRDLEVRVRRKDGQEIICEMSSTVRRGPDGDVASFQTFFRDITEQKRAQQALKESEDKFRTVAEKALVGIGLMQDGKLKYVNPCYADIFGYTEGDLIGRSPEMLIHRDDRTYVQQQVQRRLSGETDSVRYQVKGVTKDGEVRYLDVYGGQITYRDEPAVIASVMDITRQRRLKEQLLEIQEAERRRIGQELHDGIASQLTGVTMVSETLARAVANGEEVEPSELQELTDLVREAVRDARLLSRGLNPVRVGTEGLPVALEQLAERTEKQSEIVCTFHAGDEAIELEEQRSAHLYRIAQEAVNNAVKHAASDRITILLSAEANSILLSVEDDGVGLTEDVREKSEGIGLHTMRYRADLIGGKLEITSCGGDGTVVCCQVPRQGVGTG